MIILGKAAGEVAATDRQRSMSTARGRGDVMRAAIIATTVGAILLGGLPAGAAQDETAVKTPRFVDETDRDGIDQRL